MGVGEIARALPSPVVRRERVGPSVCLNPSLQSRGEPSAGCTRFFLVAAAQTAPAADATALGPSRGCSSLRSSLLTPAALSSLCHFTTPAPIQGAGSACIQSHHLFSVAAGS